jgi:hypothetical protein
MPYTYATLKEGKLFVKDREGFRVGYLSMQQEANKPPVNVRIRVEDILSGQEVQIYGTVYRGKIEYSLDELSRELKTFNCSEVRLWVEKVYGKKGMSQQQYYRSVVIFEFVWGHYYANHDFITNDTADQLLKLAVIPKTIKNEDGTMEKVPGSTEDYDTMQYELFLDKCRGFIKAYFNREVPMPERADEREFKF